jgi:hypothetical protein
VGVKRRVRKGLKRGSENVVKRRVREMLKKG